MRRLAAYAIVISGIVFAFAAAADQPVHIVRTLGPYTDVYPAGTICDFEYVQTFVVDQNIKRFLDADGNPVHAVRNEYTRVAHINADTGIQVTEGDHYTVIVDWVTGFVEQSGQFWHLRDEDGRLVLAGAGRFTMDAFTGEILSETPNVHESDFAQVICSALGGAPAP